MNSAVALAIILDTDIAVVDMADVFFAARLANIAAKGRIAFVGAWFRATNAGVRQRRAGSSTVLWRCSDISEPRLGVCGAVPIALRPRAPLGHVAVYGRGTLLLDTEVTLFRLICQKVAATRAARFASWATLARAWQIITCAVFEKLGTS